MRSPLASHEPLRNEAARRRRGRQVGGEFVHEPAQSCLSDGRLASSGYLAEQSPLIIGRRSMLAQAAYIKTPRRLTRSSRSGGGPPTGAKCWSSVKTPPAERLRLLVVNSGTTAAASQRFPRRERFCINFVSGRFYDVCSPPSWRAERSAAHRTSGDGLLAAAAWSGPTAAGFPRSPRMRAAALATSASGLRSASMSRATDSPPSRCSARLA